MTMTKKYDQYTLSWKDVKIKRPYDEESFKIMLTLLSAKGEARTAIRGILNILNTDEIDHKSVLGESKYRYMIRCTQNKLADLIGVDRGNFTRGIKQLIDLNLVYREDGVIYVNPLLPNRNMIVDKRTLDKFNIPYATNKTPSVTRVKCDPDRIRTDLSF